MVMAKYYQRIIPTGVDTYGVEGGEYVTDSDIKDGDKIWDRNTGIVSIATKDEKGSVSMKPTGDLMSPK